MATATKPAPAATPLGPTGGQSGGHAPDAATAAAAVQSGMQDSPPAVVGQGVASAESQPQSGPAGSDEELHRDFATLVEMQRDSLKREAELKSRVEHLERLVTKVTDGQVGKALEIEPLNRDNYSENKRPLIAEYLVTFYGPDRDKFAQPIRVEAISGQHAVARVVQATRIIASEHNFQSKYTGKIFKIRPRDEKKSVEGFPRKIFCDTAENALKLARLRADEHEADLIAEAA